MDHATKKIVLEAIKTAIITELRGYEIYKAAAERTEDPAAKLMFEKLAYRHGERDLIVLFHDFRAEFPDGKQERITSRLIDFGIAGGDSSMSRTVSLPAAPSGWPGFAARRSFSRP